MEIRFDLLIFIFSCSLPWYIYSKRICFSCTNLLENETCQHAISCPESEVCFVQKFRTRMNETRYDVGCTYPELCKKDRFGIVIGKRSDHSHVVCQKCCDDNVCNDNIYCSGAHEVQKQTCLSCSEIESPNLCTNSTVCEKDEICFLHKYHAESGKQHYDLGCKHSTMCLHGSVTETIGRRSNLGRQLICESCCTGHANCNQNLQCHHEIQRSFNQSCSTTTECSSNLQCLFGICQCDFNDYFFTSNACIKRKSFNEGCSMSDQCRNPFLCKNNLCKCPTTEYWDGFNCEIKKSYNEACNTSVECNNSLFCNLGRCICDRTNYWSGTTCVQRKSYNYTCKTTEECEDSLLRCIDGKCACISSEYWTGNACAIRKSFNEGCSMSDQCRNPFLCINNLCKCPTTEYSDGFNCKIKPKECADVDSQKDGVNTIYPTGTGNGVSVYCIMRADKKWTVIQRRFNFTLSFNRDWSDYKHGFGTANGEYWLGNDNIHAISSNGHHEISIYLWESQQKFGFANYSTFYVDDESNKYRLNITGYSGNTNDAMDKTGNNNARANGMKFTTKDNDNNLSSSNCAVGNGGWWHNNCYYSELNTVNNLHWYPYSSVLKKSIMMIRKT